MKNIQVLHEKSKKKISRFTTLMILFLLISVPCAFAENYEINGVKQERTISGTVTDDLGDPLIGVSVSIKGTTTGTMTDMDGRYSLSIPNNNTVLVFTYVGFDTQEITVDNKTDISIVMKSKDAFLEEVVVVGYGVQKKKLITGATVQVKGDDLSKMSTTNALDALKTMAPGMNITQSSGMPGEDFRVVIRGLGTNGGYQPLYVIDGVAGGNINNINPSDIESIDVLKDAASAAIYGARAANGVILITTKQGKAGKMQLTYDGYFGWQNPYREPSLLNAKEYMQMQNERMFNEGKAPYDFATLIPNQYQSIMDGTWNGTNWLEEIRNKNAITHNHAIGLTGGNEMSRFSGGFSYSRQDGIYGKPVEPKFERYTLRVNSEHVVLKIKDFDAIKIGENITYTYSEKSGIGIGDIYWNDIHNTLIANPLMPVYNSNGGYYDQPSKTGDKWTFDNTAVNPVADKVYRRGQNISKNHNLFANVYLEIQPIKNLKFRSSYGYKMEANSYRSYVPAYNLSSSTVNTNDVVNQNQSSGRSWTLDNTISYAFKANEHNFDVVVGQSAEKWGLGEGLSIGNLNSNFPGSWDHAWIDNTQPVSASSTINGAPWEDGMLASFFGRVNYNFKETYLATVIFRADGSSKFARGNRWGYYPSVSLGWVLTNESFMEGTRSWLDFFKLRGSWGQNANISNTPNLQYLATYSSNNKSQYFFGDDKSNPNIGLFPTLIPNPDLKWETSEQLDLGFDSRFLNGRFGVVFDYYVKKNKDLLFVPQILASWGADAPWRNAGDVENKGVELGLTWNDNIGDFTYGAGINFSYNKNKVTTVNNGAGYINGPTDVLSQSTNFISRFEEGFPIGYFYGYKTAGIFQNAEQVASTKAKLAGAQAGDVIFVDNDGDGFITDKDKTMIGDPNPDVILGINLNFGYKGFDLSITANGAFGHQIARSYRSFADSPYNNYTTEIFDRWHGEGTSNRIPRLISGSHPNTQYISDLYVEDADYIKLQNLTLGYDFKRLFPRMPLGQARVYLTAQNLFTITGYKGQDPEVGYSSEIDGNSASWARGIDLGFYSTPRTYLIGVNLKF